MALLVHRYMPPAACSVATAKAALHGYKRQAFDVDPDNNDHIESYMCLRETCKRVSPELSMTYLATRSRSVSHGESTTQEFWAAPKVNFPKLSPRMTDALADPVACEDLKVGHNKFYVVDKVAPASSLAKVCGRCRST